MPNWIALSVFVALFALVTGLGFWAARWRRGDLTLIDEWGLGGRQFGVLITWFLLGGDLYTAYTVIAVPAAVYAIGAGGIFALPYVVLTYPLVFLLMPRLWNVCKRHGFVTTADFVRGRYGNARLALAIAVTGILATLPYVALQLLGMQVVIAAMGLGGGSGPLAELPLILAFLVLAAYTYTSGLRAPAVIAMVKDVLIYIVVIVAVIVIPIRLGGYGRIFSLADAHFALQRAATPPGTGSLILSPSAYWPYATLGLGSAFALFMYPHSVTGVLSSARGSVIKRNTILLPAYSVLLGLIALLGYMAIAANIQVAKPNDAVPALFNAMFPSWFVGVAFAAIAIGALVPAAIMSIAAANLWTRNIYMAYVRPGATAAQESSSAKIASFVVKLGALLFIIWVPTAFAINLQLLGGIWILQTFPALALGLHRRIFHDAALLWGWLAGMLAGTSMSFSQGVKPTFPLHLGGTTISAYIGLDALIVNVAVSAALTVIFDRIGVARGRDATAEADYEAPPEPVVPESTLGTPELA